MKGDDRTYVKICVDCGAKTQVIDSREQENGVILRKRICPKCRYEFKTIEVEECMSEVAGVFDELTLLRTQNKKMREQLEYISNTVSSYLRD